MGLGIKTRIKKEYGNYLTKRTTAKEVKKTDTYIKEMSIKPLSKAQAMEISKFWDIDPKELLTNWHRILYHITGKEDVRFVVEPYFHNIIRPKMNDYTFASVWCDKNYIDYFIKDARTVQSVVRNVNGRFLDSNWQLLSFAEAEKIMTQYDRLVIKPSTFTNTGKGVKLLTKPYDLAQLSDEYKKNYVIQLPLTQHEDISKLNSSSINTIRINSVLFDNEAHVMSSFIKVGEAGQFADNNGKNRYFIGITGDGCYQDYAINHELEKFDEIPSGFKFAGQKVPFIEDAYRMVERAHRNIPHFGFAFWDVCISENGEPVIVEVNLRHPDTLIGQATGRPFMGDYTEKILEYIKNR